MIAQRLVRRLCPACRAPVEADAASAALLGLEPGTIVYEPRGCAECGSSGFKGRIGVFEAVRIDETIRRLINDGGDEVAIVGPRLPQRAEPRRGGARAGPRRRDHAEEAVRVSRRESEPMADFDYLALDTRRARAARLAARRDARRARISSSARGSIRRQDREPAAEAAPRPAVARPVRRARSSSAKQLTLFTRQLATLNQVSPLEESLRTIARQTEQDAGPRRPRRRSMPACVEGRRLSEAMAREPTSFPPLYRAMVAAGEGSGTLPTILERLAVLLERQAEIRGKVITALAYPAVLAIVAVFVVIALMMFVVPQVVEQFENVGQQLPFLTRDR